MIVWPTGPFRVRRPFGALAEGLSIGVVVLGILLVLLIATMAGRQPVLNLLANAGLGETVAARPDEVRCSSRGAAGRFNARSYECSLEMAGPSGRRERLVLHSIFDMEYARIGRVARIDGQLAAALPLSAMIGHAFIPLLVGGFVLVFVLAFLRIPLRQWRVRRLGPLAQTGRIVEVDLLRRRILGRSSWEWHYAFDLGGGRRYARGRLRAPPVRVDPIETRGAALVGSDGRSHLLDQCVDPLDLPADVMARLGEAILANAAAWTPYRMPALDALIAATPEGPERRYLQAWLDAWTDDVQASRVAIERRHAEEFRVAPERIDALLRQARAAATP